LLYNFFLGGLGKLWPPLSTPMKQPLYLSRQVSTEAVLSKRLQYHHNRITMLLCPGSI